MCQLSSRRAVLALLVLWSLVGAPAAPAAAAYTFIAHWGSDGSGNGQFADPQGIAVDSSGNVYVADTRNRRIQKFSSSGAYLTQWGSNGTGDGQFSYPTDVAVDSSGNVYVVDQNSHRVQKFDSAGNFLLKWGDFGAGDGQFQYPRGIAVDSAGHVYVVDTINQRIQKFDSAGNFLLKWGSFGSGNGQFYNPYRVVVDSAGNVYVADTANDRIQKFDSGGNFLLTWGSSGSGDGQLLAPQGLAVDGDNNIYVADTQNHRIQKFDSSGGFQSKWGSYGTDDGQFNLPQGIAVGPGGMVYVADTSNQRLSVWQPSDVYRFVKHVGAVRLNNPVGVAADSSSNVYIADGDSIQKFDSNGAFLSKWGSQGSGDGQFSDAQGVAVDSNGNVYVADAGNYRIQKFDSAGNFLLKWGSAGTGNGQFLFPYGLTIDSSGNVFVADTGNKRIQKFDSAGNFLLKWGSSGSGDGQFTGPSGVAVDLSGHVYVADSGNHRIQKFDSAGTFLAKWGSQGSGDAQFQDPFGLAVDSSGHVYVADTSNHRIQKFDSAGNFLARWGSQGNGDGQFVSLRGVAVSSSGHVYVADTGNYRIQKFSTTDGSNYLFQTKWGDVGFQDPQGIALDSDGNIYVADTSNHRIQKFDSAGNFLLKWGSSGFGDGQFYFPQGIAVDSSGHVYVADTLNHRIQKFDSAGNFLLKWGNNGQPRDGSGPLPDGAGSGDGQFQYPQSIAVDSSGHVYVADYGNRRIQKFDSAGNFLAKWGSLGSGDGQFYDQVAVAVDSSGHVYVADTLNHRIQKFDSDGNYLTQWGALGSGNGEFGYPSGLAVDSSGNVYVAEFANYRIQKFDSAGTFLTKWGSAGFGDGQFYHPVAVAVDASGVYVYVVDRDNHRLSFWRKEVADTTAPTTLAALAPNANAADWNRTDVQLTLGATDNDGGSGVKEVHYQIDGGTEQTVLGATAVFTLSAEGTHTIRFFAVDNAGNVEATKTQTIRIDKSAPSTSASANTDGTQITLSASDALSGVDKTYYRLDGGSQTEYTGLISLFGGGHSLEYWSVDLAGNEESPHKTLGVTTDTTAPVTTANPGPAANAAGWNRTNVTVGLNAVDNAAGVGVKEIHYRLDGGAEVTVAGSGASVSITTEGVHTLTFYAVDNAGNTETTKSLTVRIDKTAPELTFGAASPAPNGLGWNNTNVSIGYTAVDALSGVDTATPGSPLNFTGEGASQTQSVTVTDRAGNSASFSSPAVYIDKTAPTTSASLSGTLVTLSASDALSGIDRTYVKINGGTAQTYAGPFSAPAGASVSYWSVDKAGNAETARNLSVPAGPVALVSVAVSPNPVARNGAATGTVSLNQPAPAGGVLVYLLVSKAGVSVPSSVTIPVGQTSKTFSVTAGGSAVTLTLTANSTAGKKAVNVMVP